MTVNLIPSLIGCAVPESCSAKDELTTSSREISTAYAMTVKVLTKKTVHNFYALPKRTYATVSLPTCLPLARNDRDEAKVADLNVHLQ